MTAASTLSPGRKNFRPLLSAWCHTPTHTYSGPHDHKFFMESKALRRKHTFTPFLPWAMELFVAKVLLCFFYSEAPRWQLPSIYAPEQITGKTNGAEQADGHQLTLVKPLHWVWALMDVTSCKVILQEDLRLQRPSLPLGLHVAK